MSQVKVKVKVNDLNLTSELLKYGTITFIDNMVNIVFLLTDSSNINKISKLPFVIKVTKSRTASLQSA
ncbi:DUF2129 domain-containing protein [Lysinibacillus sp. SGAir0095]|uniref:DUF2129 domain-containing protein n=1 Tax=Lysinibacillus sp. SGAir0095 TaxID=2070463 RepID=UPI0010CD69F0|nr:DUF2129 domain-containing protein [Lysinibacillus sp. SGAir0095]QCR33561.1 hypothetical protein C1N55_15995 [Lysinibacillus sp. SGAir0095]